MSSAIPSDIPPPPKWVLDYDTPPRPKPKNTTITNPPGYSEATGKRSNNSKSQKPAREPPTIAETDTLKLKKSYEIALAPAKSLPMNAIMMYMSGNSLQIFSIMMVFMLFKNPISGLLATNEVFKRMETEGNRSQMWLVKAFYVAMQLLALCLGVWKVNAMGLLPTTRSDWLAWEGPRTYAEKSVFALK